MKALSFFLSGLLGMRWSMPEPAYVRAPVSVSPRKINGGTRSGAAAAKRDARRRRNVAKRTSARRKGGAA